MALLDNLMRPRSGREEDFGAPEKRAAGATVVLPRPAIKSAKLSPAPADPMRDAHIAEYAELAGQVGIMPPDLGIEAFKAFLRQHDIPVFSLSAVVSYMDDKAAKESKDKAGWEWRPLREKDQRLNMSFGREARRKQDQYGSRSLEVEVAASDYYRGPQEHEFRNTQTGAAQKHTSSGMQRAYDKTIPLHALRKVALIDKEFGGTVAFFVCDYAPAPAIEYPDPFLMAVVNNSKVEIGTGRFVIDFWDEPGFGLKQMLSEAK